MQGHSHEEFNYEQRNITTIPLLVSQRIYKVIL